MRLAVASITNLCAALLTPVAALAAGSPTIAGAPVVQPGVQEFGNTAITPIEYWQLNLIAGDQVLIALQVGPQIYVGINAYPPGTNDANVNNAQNTVSTTVGEPGLRFTAQVTGIWPVSFHTEYGEHYVGPYNFTESVYHDAIAFVPHAVKLSLRGHFTAYIRTPDGNPITAPRLAVTLYGQWKDKSFLPASKHRLATTSPTNGRATFSYKLPSGLRRQHIRFLVEGGGAEYQPIIPVSALVRVRR